MLYYSMPYFNQSLA